MYCEFGIHQISRRMHRRGHTTCKTRCIRTNSHSVAVRSHQVRHVNTKRTTGSMRFCALSADVLVDNVNALDPEMFEKGRTRASREEIDDESQGVRPLIRTLVLSNDPGESRHPRWKREMKWKREMHWHVRCKRSCISWGTPAGNADRDRWSRWHKSPSMDERNLGKAPRTRTCWVAQAFSLRLTATTNDGNNGDFSVIYRVMSQLSVAPRLDTVHLEKKKEREKGPPSPSFFPRSESRTKVNKTASYWHAD